jgi:hypothetical protein
MEVTAKVSERIALDVPVRGEKIAIYSRDDCEDRRTETARPLKTARREKEPLLLID